MELSKSLIHYYHEKIVPTSELKRMVGIKEGHLLEKPTWYVIEGKLCYFKPREDMRLFGELFFSQFARDIIGLNTANFSLATIRTKDSTISPNKEQVNIGLLSPNFQLNNNNYYMVSELLDPRISDLIQYGEYSLVSLLSYFKQVLTEDNYEKIKRDLIKLFIADAFTLQADRNSYNITFQVPKVSGVSFSQRMRMASNNSMEGLELCPVYDSERILGISSKTGIGVSPDYVWTPAFPVDKDSMFNTQEQAKEAKQVYDDCDPNLFEVISLYPEAIPTVERLAYDDEYRRVLENFTGVNKPLKLNDSELSSAIDTFEGRRDEFKLVLSRFR